MSDHIEALRVAEVEAREAHNEARRCADMMARVLADAVVDGTDVAAAANTYRKFRLEKLTARVVLDTAQSALLAAKREEVA